MDIAKKLIKEILAFTFTNLAFFTVLYFSNMPIGFKFSIATIFFVASVYSLAKTFKREKQKLDLLFETEAFLNGLAGTSEQIFGSCSQINDTASEQASAVIETSSASDEISMMINKNTDNINDVNNAVSSINKIVKLSSNSSNELEKNLEDNSQANERVVKLLKDTSGMLAELTGLFSQVVEKTAVINDIVFQTKLLSFNASVEAARAGEHGKGFSVVAEEIGNLASMSGESANSIQHTLEMTDDKVKTIINDINKGSADLAHLLQEQDEVGKKIFLEFNNNFESAIKQITSIVDQIFEIKTASSEQNKGVQEMRDAIHLVNESVQRNSLVVGQTTNLANLLNKDVTEFKSILNLFKNKADVTGDLKIEKIPWENKYSIGVDQMDNEHKILLDKINDLIEAMNFNNQSKTQYCFNELKDFTILHFTNEEAHMEKIGYDALESHKRVHKNLIDSVLKFGNQLENGTLDKTKLASFLKNWLFTHIMGVDTKYATYGQVESNIKKNFVA